MSMKTIGEWREAIERDDTIQHYFTGQFSSQVRTALDEVFPRDDQNIFPNVQSMCTAAVLCGNAISRGNTFDMETLTPTNPELMVLGMSVSIAVANVLGISEFARDLEETMDW